MDFYSKSSYDHKWDRACELDHKWDRAWELGDSLVKLLGSSVSADLQTEITTVWPPRMAQRSHKREVLNGHSS